MSIVQAVNRMVAYSAMLAAAMLVLLTYGGHVEHPWPWAIGIVIVLLPTAVIEWACENGLGIVRWDLRREQRGFEVILKERQE